MKRQQSAVIEDTPTMINQVMKQQILDMEGELTRSVKDQAENLSTIEDTRCHLGVLCCRT